MLKSNKESNYSKETINSRIYITINGLGIALYDRRPTVAKFLEANERKKLLKFTKFMNM